MRFHARAIANSYTLLLAACFFVWPVVAGIPNERVQMLWLCIAMIVVPLSGYGVLRALPKGKMEIEKMRFPWIPMTVLLAVLCAYGTLFPPFEFSDELTMMLPGFTAAAHVAHVLTWIGALGLTVAVCCFAALCALKLPWRICVIVAELLSIVAWVVIAKHVQSGLGLRYPPVDHLLQFVTTVLTFGSIHLFRLPNILWTLFLGLTVWKLTPGWNDMRRAVVFLVPLLGPLGWTYRTVLMQACGEITLGMATVLLLALIIKDAPKKISALPVFLGITLATWFLYRPSCGPVIILCLLILMICKRWKDAKTVAWIALPVAASWLLLSPYYTQSYGIGTVLHRTMGTMIITNLHALKASFVALPINLHPAVIAILLVTSALTFFKGTKESRVLLGIAWLIALVNGVSQDLLLNSTTFGVARYNILLLLPLALGCGNLLVLRLPRSTQNGAAAIAVIVMAMVTPFDFTGYAQSLRENPSTIESAPTEGYDPLPILAATEDVIVKTHAMPVVLAPHLEFLDLLQASSLITAAQKADIIARSNTWTLASQDHPVIVVAPATSFEPHLTKEQQDRLREARSWALMQPHTTKTFGREEAVIVY